MLVHTAVYLPYECNSCEICADRFNRLSCISHCSMVLSVDGGESRNSGLKFSKQNFTTTPGWQVRRPSENLFNVNKMCFPKLEANIVFDTGLQLHFLYILRTHITTISISHFSSLRAKVTNSLWRMGVLSTRLTGEVERFTVKLGGVYDIYWATWQQQAAPTVKVTYAYLSPFDNGVTV